MIPEYDTSPPMPPGTEDAFDPALRALSIEELEARVIYAGLTPPFAARQQVAGIQAALTAYPPEQRQGLYRFMLLQSLTTTRALLTASPEYWGLEVRSDRLRRLFLTVPLVEDWTPAQRQDVLRQVEAHVIPSLRADGEEDVEYWRRLYYALLIRAHATEAALGELGTTRPLNGLNFRPLAG